MKEFKVACQNTFYVIIEAKNEEEARKKIEKKINKDYDYPIDNMYEADGWDIGDVEEEEEFSKTGIFERKSS